MVRFALILLCCLTLAAPAWAGRPQGLIANHTGDYEIALPEIWPHAERSNAIAQLKHVSMDENVAEVDQSPDCDNKESQKLDSYNYTMALSGSVIAYNNGDYKTAFRKTLPLAQSGDMGSPAQLGVMCFTGQGVAQDYVYTHMWLNLAAAQGEINAAEIRDILSKTMLPADVSMA